MRETIQSHGNQGIALVTTMLFLAMLGIIGMSALERASADRRVGGFLSRSQVALFAAEAGLESVVRQLSQADLPAGAAALEGVTVAVSATPVGDSTVHPHGIPTYTIDDTATQAVDYLGAGGPCDEWAMSIELGGPMYRYSLWDVRIQGETPDGATARVQASATRCYAYDG